MTRSKQVERDKLRLLTSHKVCRARPSDLRRYDLFIAVVPL